MMIRDSKGRVGVVTEDRGDYIFAVPLGTPYVIDGENPGVGAAQYITATAWTRKADGTYSGIWYDSPMYAKSLSAAVAGAARDYLARCGQALYGDRWQSDLARATGVSDRSVRGWVAGERNPPTGVWADIAGLLRARRVEITDLLGDMDHR